MKCSIIQDLLPSYIDGHCSGETNAELKEHLSCCAECRAVYEKMSGEAWQSGQTAGGNLGIFKKLKSKILRRGVIAAFAVCLILVSGLLAFAFKYEIPIPYDGYRMRADVIPFAVVSMEDGGSAWAFADGDTTPYYEPAAGESVLEYMDGLILSYNGFDNISMCADGRDIDRNGQTVRVVYYRYTKSPWMSLFYDYDLTDYRSSGSMSGTQIYGPGYGSIDYEPQTIEIYYLPAGNFNRVEKLSDEDFDAERANGTLVWRGII